MKLNRELPWNSLLCTLVLGLGMLAFAPEIRANVFATNIRINGGTTNIVASTGETFSVSYLLNEPASAGATVQLRLAGGPIRNLFLPPGIQGTLRGFNEVTWDGSDPNNPNAPGGTYTVSVIPASTGYTNWTQITSDTDDPNTYVPDGHGIAVDLNLTSPYYGRIFVANSSQGPGTSPSDAPGILKFNADTSDAEEGISSVDQDGHPWAGRGVSPWKVEVSADDYVYVDDLSNGGELYRWDPTISSNSLLYVLRLDNQPPGAALSGPAIDGRGSDAHIWMVDTNSGSVIKWPVTTNSVCVSNDTGITNVIVSTATNLSDVAVDKNGNIYTCALVTASGDPAPRVFRYSLSTSLPVTNADWAVGGGDDTYGGASGIAVDPTGTYVAVAFEGTIDAGGANGNTKILWATNGAMAANLDLRVFMQGDPLHDDRDCAWDAVGNVYYIDNEFARWRAFSPPGTNQAVTVALAAIQLPGAPPSATIEITRLTVMAGNVNIDFSAGLSDSASSFAVQGAATVNGTYSAIAGAVITQVAAGQFHATFPSGPDTQYFRIARTGAPPPSSQPAFTKMTFSGANVLLTFTGSTSDAASDFTILSATTVNGSYLPAQNVSVAQISPGVFQASLPFTGPTQFYRIRR